MLQYFFYTFLHLFTQLNTAAVADYNGRCWDQVWVVGYGLDSIKLTTTLRKKVGPAELLLVGDADTATDAATAVRPQQEPVGAIVTIIYPPLS
jgi:hypothetical protein